MDDRMTPPDDRDAPRKPTLGKIRYTGDHVAWLCPVCLADGQITPERWQQRPFLLKAVCPGCGDSVRIILLATAEDLR